MVLAGSAFFWIVALAVIVLTIAGTWMTYVKADQPGWASIIPFYNIYMMLKIVGRPGWWLILFFIPFVNIIVGIMVLHRVGSKLRARGGICHRAVLPSVYLLADTWLR